MKELKDKGVHARKDEWTKECKERIKEWKDKGMKG